jgi:hypothetical protein
LSAKAPAAYLSAYFVTGERNKITLQESVPIARMPRSIVHVSTSLTQTTGITMRELRFRRLSGRIGRGSSGPGLSWGLVTYRYTSEPWAGSCALKRS